MELLALVLINIFFAVIVYYIVSIKINNAMNGQQGEKMKADLRAHMEELLQEADITILEMESKINIFRNLIKMAKDQGIDLTVPYPVTTQKKDSDLKNRTNSGILMEEKLLSGTSVKIKIHDEIPIEEKLETGDRIKNLQEKKELIEGVLTGLGKGMKSIFGIGPVHDLELEESTKQKQGAIREKQSHLVNLVVSGDPFEEAKFIDANKDESSNFQNMLESFGKAPLTDHIQISANAALREIPEGSSKIDKAVFLLKKNYKPSEISEELGISMDEVEIIRTIKLAIIR